MNSAYLAARHEHTSCLPRWLALQTAALACVSGTFHCQHASMWIRLSQPCRCIAGAPVTFWNAQQRGPATPFGQAAAAPPNPFGVSSSAPSAANPFGQTPSAFGFGAQPTQQPTAGFGGFGLQQQTQQQQQQPAPPAFGQTPHSGFGMQPTQAGGMGGFGQQKSAQSGLGAQPLQQPQNTFGPQQPTQGGFGSGDHGPGGFGGQPTQQPQSGFPAFGGVQQPGFAQGPPGPGLAPGAGPTSPGVGMSQGQAGQGQGGQRRRVTARRPRR